MKLGIDLTIFRTYQGTEVYTENLIAHLVPQAIQAGHTVVLFKGFDQFAALDQLAQQYAPTELTVVNVRRGRNSIGVVLTQQLLLPFWALWHRLDVLYSTAPFFSFLAPCKKINTIHDAGYARFNVFRNRLSQWYIQTSMYLSHWLCARVVTVSEFSRNELTSQLHFSERQLVVISPATPALPAVNPLEDADILQMFQLTPQRYIFYVGRLSPHKNIDGMIAAFEQFCTSQPEGTWQFILAGSHNRDCPQRTAPLKQVRLIGTISNAHKVVLIRNAALMLFPSLYEGFGSPVLEAQSLGCPVVTSNTTSLPAVAGTGAIFVDPTDVSAIAQAMTAIVNHDIDVPTLIKRGQDNLARFSWSTSARTLLETVTAECT